MPWKQTIDTVVRAYDWNLSYARKLVEDIPLDLMAKPAGSGLENHPAFTIGHLVTGSGLMAAGFHEENTVPQSIRDLCERRGPGDPRLPGNDSETSPPMDELLAELERQHSLVVKGLREYPPERWSETVEWRFGKALPEALDVAVFMLITHEAMHLAQLSAWRRGMGLPSALAAL